MKIKSLLLAATLSVAAFTASATPQYSGNTFGTDISQPFQGDTGFYLWNDENSPRDWFLRWTDTTGDSTNPFWFGELVFETSNLGAVNPFLFEANTDSVNVSYSGIFADSFRWEAVTNTSGGVDGINFSITSDVELMEINLGSTSSVFAGMTEVLDDPGVASTGIFIGSGFAGTNVLIKEVNGFMTQSFEIQVPAPGVLALLGLGIFGLSLVRRK